ncbi:hypothetical protein ASPACDRAFT_36577 [Aspergillus aculeatus ATCC 16872]|uniref:Amino acid permease/ SLC12A domain-containing protein n=1 Tax=Aspergillus aculeatus (strain ATCC 16872 / CBS 172.66 / WB 5094) TaxID=690307 RepID=A0A1L9WG93_ASPA1|nr:uncharacterized protein ASPACDRAFT_36577 [Aspergillus aculeatus ATCC 16872]OJJ95192.1 hypothetical protein ASPACDRAFT_36577 [Aspergillus aculeatus ATCC 16872]
MGKSVESAQDQHDVEIGVVATLAHEGPGLKRNFNMISIMALGFNTSNSWIAIAGSLPLAIAGGGTVTLLYGILVVCFAMSCTGLSLAELAAVYPSAGGQYYFTSMLAPAQHRRWLSYMCGIIGIWSWVAIAASLSLMVTEGIMAMVLTYHPTFVPQSWHYFLMYQAVHIIAMAYNVGLLSKTVWVYDWAFYFSLALFVITTIVCPARSAVHADSATVWGHFVNSSNGYWSNGIVFLTGLSTPSYMLIGLDATMHMADECLAPARTIPRAILSTVGIGSVAAFAFALAMCYSVTDFDSLVDAASGFPIYDLWAQASRSTTCATVFLVVMISIMFVSACAIHSTASRLTWSFACDNGIFLSGYLKQLDHRQGVPLYALGLNFIACFVIGFLYLASSSVFNAFVGTASILSQISVTLPIALLIWQRRSEVYLPSGRHFGLSSGLGYFCNIVAVVYTIIITIFLCFPTSFPLTGGNMNYTAPVLGVIAILTGLNWVFYARGRYEGAHVG